MIHLARITQIVTWPVLPVGVLLESEAAVSGLVVEYAGPVLLGVAVLHLVAASISERAATPRAPEA